MNFGKAFEALEAGTQIRRASWRKGLVLDIMTDCDSQKGYSRSFAMFDNGKILACGRNRDTLSDAEILADNWEIVSETTPEISFAEKLKDVCMRYDVEEGRYPESEFQGGSVFESWCRENNVEFLWDEWEDERDDLYEKEYERRWSKKI